MTPIEALVAQCEEQRIRCLYTSTQLFIWLRFLRLIRIAFIVVPIVFGAIAGWDLLKANGASVVAAVFALVAGLVPAIYAALKLDEHLPTTARLAGEYKNLEIVFADLKRIGPTKGPEAFEAEYKEARDRLEAANAEAYTAPEWCFKKAQKKIDKGNYAFDEAKPGSRS